MVMILIDTQACNRDITVLFFFCLTGHMYLAKYSEHKGIYSPWVNKASAHFILANRLSRIVGGRVARDNNKIILLSSPLAGWIHPRSPSLNKIICLTKPLDKSVY